VKRILSAVLGAALCTSLASFSAAAVAQAYPSKPITMVVPFPAGGITDNGARLFAKMLGDRLGQQVNVDNQGGASGTIAAQFVKRAKADGYTILYGTSGPMVAVHSLMKSVPYDTLKDFTPIYGLAETPMVLVTQVKSPYKNLGEMVEYARKNPGKLSFGSPGAGTAPHLAGELLKMNAKIDMLHVPYKGMAPAMTDLLGGRIDFMFDYAATIAPHVASGTLRPLALSTGTRLAAHPAIPTASELGYTQVNLAPWTGIFMPAGAPKEVVDKLTGAIESTVKDPAMLDYYHKGGQQPLDLKHDRFSKFIETELVKWKGLIERASVDRQ
jgi:tripartite-type tricarboxylate transporter receptor subunit TctC